MSSRRLGIVHKIDNAEDQAFCRFETLFLWAQDLLWLAGIMLYGTGYWGVTEANYLVVGGHFLSAIFGARLWEGDYSRLLGHELPYGITLRRGDLSLLLILYGGVHQSLGCIIRTLKAKVFARPAFSQLTAAQGLQRHESTCCTLTNSLQHLCLGSDKRVSSKISLQDFHQTSHISYLPECPGLSQTKVALVDYEDSLQACALPMR